MEHAIQSSLCVSKVFLHGCFIYEDPFYYPIQKKKKLSAKFPNFIE